MHLLVRLIAWVSVLFDINSTSKRNVFNRLGEEPWKVSEKVNRNTQIVSALYSVATMQMIKKKKKLACHT